MNKTRKTSTNLIAKIMIIILVFTSIGLGNVKASAATTATGQDIVNYAKKFLGTPYVYAGTTPSGFDCSGFTRYLYQNVTGIDIGRTTWDQAAKGYSVSYSELKVGDLVVTEGVEHIGIYVGNGQMIHSPKPGDVVKISPIYNFHSARRILKEKPVEDDILFNSDYYSNTYPDVAKQVREGKLPSARYHYDKYGKAEGRRPIPELPTDFDEYVYLLNNKDVAEVVKKGVFKNGAEHWVLYGWSEKHRIYSMPVGWSDERYLGVNKGLKEAIAKDGMTAKEHYIKYGKAEGRKYMPELPADFDEYVYLLNHPDVAEVVKKGVFKNGAEHWVLYGWSEKHRIYSMPVGWSDERYLELNKGLKESIAKEGMTAKEHYIKYGKAEGRKYL